MATLSPFIFFPSRTEKQIMPLKRTLNWLFNDICYLVIASLIEN